MRRDAAESLRLQVLLRGVDFTSRPSPRKPIIIAEGVLNRGPGGGVLNISALQRIETLDGFELAMQEHAGAHRQSVTSVDFPLGMARSAVDWLKWGPTAAKFHKKVRGLSREEFRSAMKRCARALGGEQHRVCDRAEANGKGWSAGSISAMHTDFPAVGFMLLEGLPRILDADVSVLPIRPTTSSRVVIEGYSGLVARWLIGNESYKGGKPASRKARLAARRRMVGMLMSERLRERYGFTVSVTAGHAATCMEDAEGDALDAVLMCVQAAWASGQEGCGVPRGVDEVEGWIADPETLEHFKRQQPASEEVLLKRVYGVSVGMEWQFPQVVAGPGHDCAVVRVGEEELLLKTDQVIEGRHFVAGTSVELIARKALARTLSDIAAAAGEPVAALVAAALPDGDVRGRELVDAVHKWGRKWKCPVVGGDIARTNGPLGLTVSVMGRPATERGAVLRSGARVGDDVWVTGELGGSFDKRTGLGRHLTFEPRLVEAKELAEMLGEKLRAMMDLSDGLGRDATRLSEMSHVGVEIEAERVPRSRGVKTWKRAISDGEDYELLFVTAPGVKIKTLGAGTRVTRIGRVVAFASGKPRASVLVGLGKGRKRLDVSTLGWEHGT